MIKNNQSNRKRIEFNFVICAIFLSNLIFMGYKLSLLPGILSERKKITERMGVISGNLSVSLKMKSDKRGIVDSGSLQFSEKENRINSFDKLNIKLLGICYGRIPLVFIEMLEHKMTGIFTEGSIVNEAKILKILPESIIIEFLGQKKQLFLENFNTASVPILQLNENERVIKKDALGETVMSLVKELNKLKIETAKDEASNSIVGLRLLNLETNSFFEKMGLQNNDVVGSVNKVPIRSIDEAIAFAKQIQVDKVVEIEVKRSANSVSLKYYIIE